MLVCNQAPPKIPKSKHVSVNSLVTSVQAMQLLFLNNFAQRILRNRRTSLPGKKNKTTGSGVKH